jgi:hypothetical protein
LTFGGVTARMEIMQGRARNAGVWTAAILLALLARPALVTAQQSGKGRPEQPASPANKLTIEVTGGDENKPIENASVYLKTVEEHLIKDKKFEVNVKTNQKGLAHVPDAPTGKVLIQVVAEGWKTYGQWYDVADLKQMIKIHLERPPKWY